MKMLQQKDFPAEYYKKIKHEFFSQKKNLVGKPKDGEIASIALFYMIRKNMIKDELELNKLLELPFFKKNIYKPEIFHEALKLKNPNSFVLIEPSKLDNEEYLQRVENDIKNRILVENQSIFNEQREKYKNEIEQMKRQLATLPTRLEKRDFEEPKVEEEEGQPKQEWWQILNLVDDPFPLAEGLQKINGEMYEDIIVRTEIFKKYMNYADKLRNQIFKNTIFYGDFGSGKTAFFDYLRTILLRNKILSVYVQLWVGLDNDTNIYKFQEQLLTNLLEECERYGVIVNDIDHKNHSGAINKILQHLADQKGFVGFLIFVDDLHKNTKAFDLVVDFLSYLQIFTATLTKGNVSNLATYIAGIPQWKNKINSEPRLSGSLIRDEEMPPVTEKDAYDMLNKRMLTFSKNQDKKNIIGTSFVKQIYLTLQKNNVSITFREFLKRALEEFRNENFDRVLTVNPKAIPTDILHDIHSMIYENPNLSYRFDELFNRISNAQQENRQKCFEILGGVYLEKGILESAPQVDRNSWAFQQLVYSGLLGFIELENDVKWVVNKDLLEVNKRIIDRFKFSMEDFLIPVFLGSAIFVKKKFMSPELEILEDIKKIYLKSTNEKILAHAISDYEPLLAIDLSHKITTVPYELVEKCLQSLSSLTKAFMSITNIEIPEGDDLTIITFWKDFWYKPAAMVEFINQMDTVQELDINRANYIFGFYKDSFTEIVTFLKTQSEKDRIFGISYKNLTNDDCVVLDSTRDMWIKKEYYQMCSSIVSYLENKLRKDLFNIMTLIYGEKNRNNHLDPKIQKNITEKGNKDEKKGFSSVKNDFQHLDRKDYKFLMTGGPSTNPSQVGHKNWEDMFSIIFAPWTEDDLYRFLDKWGDYNTATSHNKNQVISDSQQPDLRQFVLNSMTFLQRLNGSYRKLLKNGIIDRDSKFFFSFKKNPDVFSQEHIDATTDEFERIKKRMLKMGEIEVQMDDDEYVVTFFGLNYRKFVMIIGLLLNMDEIKKKKIGAELSIMLDRSPKFYFKLNSIL